MEFNPLANVLLSKHVLQYKWHKEFHHPCQASDDSACNLCWQSKHISLTNHGTSCISPLVKGVSFYKTASHSWLQSLKTWKQKTGSSADPGKVRQTYQVCIRLEPRPHHIPAWLKYVRSIYKQNLSHSLWIKVEEDINLKRRNQRCEVRIVLLHCTPKANKSKIKSRDYCEGKWLPSIFHKVNHEITSVGCNCLPKTSWISNHHSLT